MAVELYSEPNQDVLITGQLGYSDTGLFLQAVIYDIQDLTTPIETLNLDEIGEGAYAKKWTNPGELTKYWVRIFVYTDSGYTVVSEIDRPAEISINVGRYSGGGVFGGSTKVARTSLTEEEIEKIAKKVKEILQPEFNKKSEFNPKKELVKIEPIKLPKPIKIPEIPKYNEGLLAKKLAKQIEINGDITKKEIQKIKESIKNIKFPEIHPSPKPEVLYDDSEIKTALKEIWIAVHSIQGDKDYTREFSNVKESIKYNQFLSKLNKDSNPQVIFNLIQELSGKWKKKAFLELIKFPRLIKEVSKL
jgi:hypothetical protein